MTAALRARILAQSLAALALTLGVAGLLIGPLVGTAGAVTHMFFSPITTIAYALVGTLIATRQPRNPIGWIFSAVGVFAGLTTLLSDDNQLGLCQWIGAGETCVAIARWISLWDWMPTTMLPMSFVLLLFPDGRLPSPRWRPVAWAAGVGLMLLIVSTALHPHPPIDASPRTNPFGISAIATELELIGKIAWPLIIVGVLGAVAALVVRFRNSRGVEREQVKWLAYGSSLAILILVFLSAWSATRPDDQFANDVNIGGVWITLTVIVVTAGIAILRHRLYDIDIIINRTLVYGALSAGVLGLYVLLVGALGALFQSSGNLLVALLATGLAALLAHPLRVRLQRSVNRLMYGERDDPYTVLSQLSQQLKSTLAPNALLPSIAEAIAQTLKLPYVAIALRQDDDMVVVAEARVGNRELGVKAGVAPHSSSPVSHLPLIYQGDTVGELRLAPRAGEDSFGAGERRLLDDIALQAGIAAHAVQLTADLQRSRERLIAAREEERRRLRRDLHDGLGPQLASMTLTLAAARELLRHDVGAADMLLQELSSHAQAAITDIRRVVYDLRPPALDDFGLVLALREQAARYSQAGLQIAIDAPEQLPPLPAAVEVAAYRITQEALTNVVRHSRAHTCGVRLRLGDMLEVEIRDDGIGLPASRRAGVGLTSMRERTAELGGTCEIVSAPGRGVAIHARLPLRQGGV
jgi:signal transduction histidine kinase